MNLIAIITARGGSKRLPRKNVLPFCGKPLVEWSIIQARCARCLTEGDIYLSTDDDEIAAIGERNNIQVIRRPDWPDADRMSAHPVLLHAVETLQAQRSVTHFVHLLPTSPCRHPGDIDRMWQAYLQLKRWHHDCQRVICVAPQQETVLWRREGPRVRCATYDKDFGYFSQGPSTIIYETGWWRKRIWREGAGRYDGEEITTRRGRRFRNHPWYYAIAHWYQGFDADGRDTFELNEVLFERYVLRGRGAGVYWNYLEGGIKDE